MNRALSFFFAVVALAVCAGCGSTDVRAKLESVPGVAFKSWTHTGRYGVFTDALTLSGASWTVNPDGSASLQLDRYDGSAAWAGTIGPHDVIEGLVVTFPPGSPQAESVKATKTVGAP